MHRIKNVLIVAILIGSISIIPVSCGKKGLFGSKDKGTVTSHGTRGVGACGFKIDVELAYLADSAQSYVSYKPINLPLKYQEDGKKVRLTFETVSYPTSGANCGPFIRIKSIKAGW